METKKLTVFRCLKCENIPLIHFDNNLDIKYYCEPDYITIKLLNFLKENKLIITKSDNFCLVHNKPYSIFSYNTHYCSECQKKHKITNYIELKEISLSENDIKNFNEDIKEAEENIKKLIEIKEILYKEINNKFQKIISFNEECVNLCKELISMYRYNIYNYNLIMSIKNISFNKNKIFNLDHYDEKIQLEYKIFDFIKFISNYNVLKENICLSNKINDLSFHPEKLVNKGKYYITEEIIKGGFGTLYKAYNINNTNYKNELYAIKKIKRTDMSKSEYLNEIKILKLMKNCENSIEYIDSYEDKNYLCIITKYCEKGNLRNIINKKEKGLTLKNIKYIFSHINKALKHLRKLNISYRDIKPENILIDYDYNYCNYIYYLSDYGASKEDNELKNLEYNNIITKLYNAPEIDKNKNFNIKSDLYSIGILLYELYYGNKYKILSQNEILDNINKGLIKIRHSEKEIEDNDEEFLNLKNLIENLLKEVNDRINWEEYFNHKFFKNNNINNIILFKKIYINSYNYSKCSNQICLYKSVKKEYFLVSYEKNFIDKIFIINFYNLRFNKILKQIKIPFNNNYYISCIKHYCKDNNDIIIISFEYMIKIFKVDDDYRCISTIKGLDKISSILIIKDKNNYFLIYSDFNSNCLKLYDLNGKFIKILCKCGKEIDYLESYNDNIQNKLFIICKSSNIKNKIKSYIFKEESEYKEYNICTSKNFILKKIKDKLNIIFINNKSLLFYDFYNGNKLDEIILDIEVNQIIRNIFVYNEDNLIIGIDNLIRVINIKNKKFTNIVLNNEKKIYEMVIIKLWDNIKYIFLQNDEESLIKINKIE